MSDINVSSNRRAGVFVRSGAKISDSKVVAKSTADEFEEDNGYGNNTGIYVGGTADFEIINSEVKALAEGTDGVAAYASKSIRVSGAQIEFDGIKFGAYCNTIYLLNSDFNLVGRTRKAVNGKFSTNSLLVYAKKSSEDVFVPVENVTDEYKYVSSNSN